MSLSAASFRRIQLTIQGKNPRGAGRVLSGSTFVDRAEDVPIQTAPVMGIAALITLQTRNLLALIRSPS